jgi:hypothetical protein
MRLSARICPANSSGPEKAITFIRSLLSGEKSTNIVGDFNDICA